jgi:uncharacterized protein
VPRTDSPVYSDCPADALEAVHLGVPLRRTGWSFWDALWAILGSVVISAITASVLLALGVDDSSGWTLLAIASQWIAMAGWPLWVTRARGNGAQIDLGLRLRPIDLATGLAGGIGAFAAAVVAGLITAALFGDFTSAAGDQAQQLADSGGPALLLLFALMVAVGAPIAEELTFRGLLWSGVAKRGGPPWLSIGVSACAFALIHFEPSRLLVLLAVGTVLGVVRWRTGSLGACIVAHGINNLPGAIGILALAYGH